jgi:large subunit ribosomal protein L3
MAGHMGDKLRTIQNLEIIKSDIENNLIFVKGSVPGSKNSLVLIQKHVKKINRTSTTEKQEKAQSQSSSTTEKVKKAIKTPEKKDTNTLQKENKEVKK